MRRADDMVTAHLDLPRRVAARMCRTSRRLTRGTDIEDLVQAGTIGLIRAAKDYQPDKGKRFDSYAWLRIDGAIRDWLRTDGLHKRERPGVKRPRFRLESALTAAGEHRSTPFLEHLPAPAASDRLERVEEIDGAVRPFTLPERVAFLLYHGHDLTMREIGVVLGVTESRVCQVLARVKRRMEARR